MTKQPQYRRIADQLKRQIQQGSIPTGALLPSEHELCAQFATSRMTVRQALNELVREGFIERQHGKGSLVRSARQALGLLSFKGFSEVVGGANHRVRTETLQPPTHSSWPDPFFYPLTASEQQAGCIGLDRLRYADDQPVMLEQTYLPAATLSALTTTPFLDGSLFRTLSVQFDVTIQNLEQVIRAVAATPAQAAVFGIRPGEPLLHLERRYLTNRPELFIYSSLYCYTAHYPISNNL